jgi:hypothetical protein
MKSIALTAIIILFTLPAVAQNATQSKPGNTPVPDCGAPMPPVIFQSPASQTVCPSSNAVFIASAHSRGPHWEMSTDNGITWTFVPANSYLSPFNDFIYQPDTLIVFSVGTNMNGYLFRCDYEGFCHADAYTNAATLTVAAINPQISSQPQDISVCKSFAADFTVAATGSSPDYQWQQSIDGGSVFSNLPGKTNSTLTVDSVTVSMNSYQYRCILGSPCASSVTSSPAVLTVRNESTTILTQPASQSLCSSDTAILSVLAQGNNLSYQWQDYYTADISGATDPTLRLQYMEGHHSYRCKITSTCKTIYSNTATLDYTITPNLLPAEVLTVCNGKQVYVTAITNFYESNPAMQWQVSTDSSITFNNIPNENLQYLAVTGSAAVHGNRYRCYISNSCFTGYSNVHKVYNNHIAAVVTLQPQNKDICAGSTVMFSTNSTDDISVSDYQWQVSTNNGVSFTDLNNAVGKDLTLSAVTGSMNNFQYRCKILGCGDTAYSNAAVLIVKPRPSLGNDTTVNVTCDTCTADIASMYNTNVFANTYWSTTQPAYAKPGKHSLKVFNTDGCRDSTFIYVNVTIADTIRACDGAALKIVCNITGTVYQWEWDNYGPLSFSNISDYYWPYSSEFISGTNSPVLYLRGVFIWGRIIRCRVDGNLYTNNIYVIPTTYWNGSIDSNWNNPSNWSCGKVPGSNMEVIIPESARFVPLINIDASCKKLFIRKNTQVIIAPGTNLRIGLD